MHIAFTLRMYLKKLCYICLFYAYKVLHSQLCGPGGHLAGSPIVSNPEITTPHPIIVLMQMLAGPIFGKYVNTKIVQQPKLP